MEFKKGDVVTVENWGHGYTSSRDDAAKMGLKNYAYGDSERFNRGETGTVCKVVGILPESEKVGIRTSDGKEHVIHSRGLKIKSSNMKSLSEKMALVFKGEPQKSFIKAGIMNADESLTDEGQQVFLAFLIKENGEKFKKDVVDPILAEDSAE